MKNGWIAAIGMAVLTVGSAAWAQVPGPTLPKPDPRPTIPGIRPTIPLPIKLLECRDPKAMGVKFAVISKDPAWPTTRGKIRITGEVKNVGNAAFESDPRQASAQLLEERPGVRAEMKAQQNIARLNPGQSINLNYDRAWDVATEFPPKFILMIVYDPDIYIDANKKNDDCNRNNNQAELTGQTINKGW